MLYVWHSERVAPPSATNYLTHVAFLLEVQVQLPRPDWKTLPLLNRVKRARRLQFGKARNKKLPLTFRLATKIIYDIGLTPDAVQPNNLLEASLICIMLIGICGMFRLGELLLKQRKNHNPLRVLRHGQIRFFDQQDFRLAGGTTVRIWLFLSKGDIYGDGTPIFIPSNPTDRRTCPVTWLRTILSFTKDASLGDRAPVFTMPNGDLMLKGYFIRWLKMRLKALDFNPKLYSGHSLRRGGAVSAQRNGVPDHVIQRMGRWRSHAYQLYLKHTPQRLQNLKDHLKDLSAIRSDHQ